MNIEEAYNTIKKSVEAINTRPYATKAEYEEKKAIGQFKNFIYTYQDVIEDEYSDYEEKEDAKEYQEVSEKILNIIEKQQKEIEALKENNGYHLGFIDGGIAKKYEYQDKIKAIIEEFKTVRDTILKDEKELNRSMMTYDLKRNDYCEKMLQSLLEKE